MNHAVEAGGRVLLSLPLLLLTTGGAGFAAGQFGNATISVDVDLVVLHATVRSRHGGFVSGLEKKDFRVMENGVPQTIRFLEHEDVPVALGLIVDNSGSMRPKRDDVVAAALVLARHSNPKDQLFVVNFNEHVSLGLPDTEMFSARPDDLTVALKGIPANGRTALYDAIETGFEHVKMSKLEKKVLIVISDGGDNASHHTLAQVLHTAGISNTIVYTVGLFDEYNHDRNPRVLRQLARATGGEAFLPRKTSDVIEICRRIAKDIRNQYTIGYVPTNRNLDGSYRKLQVTATGKHGGKLLVRTRAGYLASPDRNAQAMTPGNGAQ